MKRMYLFIILFIPLLLTAQNDSEINKANEMMHKASLQFLVHKNYNEALTLYEQASDLYRKHGEKNNRKYLEAIRGIADCHEKMNNDSNAIKYYRILLKRADAWQSDYACLKLGRLYHKTDNIDAAISAYEEGIYIYRTAGLGWKNNYFLIFKELFYLYYEIGNLDESIKIGKELSDIIKIDVRQWIAISTDLALIYFENGKYADGSILIEEILSISVNDDFPQTTQLNIASTLFAAGKSYMDNGNYDKAIDYYEQGDVFFKKNLNNINNLSHSTLIKFKGSHISLLTGLSTCYSNIGKNESSIKVADEAYKIVMENNLGEEFTTNCITQLATMYLCNNQESKAINLYNDAIANCSNTITKARIYNSFGIIYSKDTKSNEAIEYFKKAISLVNNPIYLHNLSICYSERQKYEAAAVYISQYWELVAKQMSKLFLQNTEEERNNVWNQYKQLIKTPIDLLWQTYNKDIVKYAFNSLLITKSIQLATTIEFRNIINKYNDKDIHDLYSKLINTPIEHNEYRNIELELVSKLQNINTSSYLFNIRWEDIKNGLNKNDLAIEFTHITRTDTGENAYFALLLRKNWDAPKCVRICTDNSVDSLKKCNINKLYNSSNAGKLIWNDILNTAQDDGNDIKNIYFVPDGALYSMAIEYMMYDSLRMNERFNMHRLTSTRDILHKNKRTNIKNAVLFGGIDYNTTVEDMEYYSYEMQQRSNNNNLWTYLPGTKKEVAEVNKILSQKSYQTETHSGNSCVEESFKKYSNSSPDIIHIATHGFYLPYNDETAINTNSKNQYDDALKRCGLAFAGANNTLLGNRNIPDGIDDGILSASEISRLNLNNTAIVVMSACQTGLGDISDDGVFGLQRAFKKAGVETILMTLWPVDDFFTQKFMTEFYKGITDGLSYNEALKNAQQQIRQTTYTDNGEKTHNGNDPYYWAPFVLLD